MGATTVYVTHDQLEAMQMGDKIVVMNHGVVEQFGTPQQIYDHPATMFVADFIGSPAMNFLSFEGAAQPGDEAVRLDGVEVAMPRIEEAPRGDKLVLGVRPEHVALTDSGSYRGEVAAAEYLGTTQIVTVTAPHGRIKARIPSGRVARVGEVVGLGFNPSTLSLFDASTGRALRTAANAGVFHV
jgi:multiple sugar transport system ATP-binding protein